MTRDVIVETTLVAAATGMRTFSGPAALAARYAPQTAPALGLLAAGEFAADKLPFVGDRIEAGPLAGRAVTGALAGAFIARQRGGNPLAAAALGAAVAVAATHVAFRLRQAAPGPPLVAALVEDAIVGTICAAVAEGIGDR